MTVYSQVKMYRPKNLSSSLLDDIQFLYEQIVYKIVWFIQILLTLCGSFIEMLESSYSKAVKQASIQVIVIMSSLRASIGSTVLQRSVQWVSFNIL